MVLDREPAIRSKWKVLGDSLWLGEINKNARGVRVQDVKITGIPLENARQAIRICRIRQKRILNAEELIPSRPDSQSSRRSIKKALSGLRNYRRGLARCCAIAKLGVAAGMATASGAAYPRRIRRAKRNGGTGPFRESSRSRPDP